MFFVTNDRLRPGCHTGWFKLAGDGSPLKSVAQAMKSPICPLSRGSSLWQVEGGKVKIPEVSFLVPLLPEHQEMSLSRPTWALSHLILNKQGQRVGRGGVEESKASRGDHTSPHPDAVNYPETLGKWLNLCEPRSGCNGGFLRGMLYE